MTFSQAKKRAISINPYMSSYCEYPDAWVFFPITNMGYNQEIVILRDSGTIMTFSDYIMGHELPSKDPEIKKL